MSISSALSNAVSGLTAVSRSAELVSANVANAMTEGYGRRELTLGAAVVGGRGAGVTITGVDRIVNEAALADRRLSDAAFGYQQSRAEFFSEIERTMGTPELPGSLSAHMARFDQSLIVAAGDPASDIKLSGVLTAATELAGKFNAISDTLQLERERADTNIGTMVARLNNALQDVDELNRQIQQQTIAGGSTAGLMDQRQAIIDEVAGLVPIQSIPREYGQISLLTPNGTTLVGNDPARFEYSVTPVITPDQTVANGALSSLLILGSSSSSGTALESISGGALAAAFELRDQEIPALQSNLDALALDFSERSSRVDVGLVPGSAGFFSDRSNAVSASNSEGLSGRIQVNAGLDPNLGGELWRIRDGLGPTAPGPVSNQTFLSNLASAFDALEQPALGSFSNAGSVSSLIGDLVSQVGQDRQAALTRQSYQAARSNAFRDLELEGGVDTDQEMQKLILIEQNFAANAKVIQAVDEMLQSLLRI